MPSCCLWYLFSILFQNIQYKYHSLDQQYLDIKYNIMAYTRKRKSYKKHKGGQQNIFGFIPSKSRKSNKSNKSITNKSIKSQRLFYNCKSNDINELRSNCQGLKDHLLKAGEINKNMAEVDDKKIAELEKNLKSCGNQNKKLIRINKGLFTDNDKLLVENEQLKMELNEFKTHSDTIDEIDAILRAKEQKASKKRSKKSKVSAAL
jgi:hypothetical protein